MTLTSCHGKCYLSSLISLHNDLLFLVTAAAKFSSYFPLGNLNTSYWQYHWEPCDWRVCHFTGKTSLIVGIKFVALVLSANRIEVLRYHLFLKTFFFPQNLPWEYNFPLNFRVLFFYLLVEIWEYYYSFLINSNLKTKVKERCSYRKVVEA